jgi:hypothetical protein
MARAPCGNRSASGAPSRSMTLIERNSVRPVSGAAAPGAGCRRPRQPPQFLPQQRLVALDGEQVVPATGGHAGHREWSSSPASLALLLRWTGRSRSQRCSLRTHSSAGDAGIAGVTRGQALGRTAPMYPDQYIEVTWTVAPLCGASTIRPSPRYSATWWMVADRNAGVRPGGARASGPASRAHRRAQECVAATTTVLFLAATAKGAIAANQLGALPDAAH